MNPTSITGTAIIVVRIRILRIITNYQNIIKLLLTIELLLLTISLLLSTQIHSLLFTLNNIIIVQILTIAAAETATGLRIITAYYRTRGTIRIKSLNLLRG
uniref:NADH-ubiquinone oxidoreductase chain 4L n=1 Tax=Aphrocallistes vastus TaxID=83887 RepID=B2BRP2_APHVA|nr:NADH dehydrogenase subunit 4L [Aphrocallistes vastus]ABR58836.1 NADH dehydrogenase subunit 4L [Aphrocallistes vastus]